MIIVFNVCIGLCTPPVGTVLFIGCSLTDLSIGRLVRPLLPFFPLLSLWLPRDVLGLIN